jgi:SAM-dependent methyltransferase
MRAARLSLRSLLSLVSGLSLVSCRAPAAPQIEKPSIVVTIAAEAERVRPLTVSPFARAFLDQAARLAPVRPRTLFTDAAKSRYWSEAEAALVPAAERAGWETVVVDDEGYYETGYGTPISYSDPLDVLATSGFALAPGDRVLDFGYGYIGHLRMLASLGLTVVGVDVDPKLRALYSAEGDQGAIAQGSVRLVDGLFPRDPAVRASVGTGYRLILSKNVLKRGYIHPDRPADPRHLIDLGLPDDAVLAGFHDALRPGGRMLVYNICPALSPADKPFVPWSDGRSPYTRAQWEAAGFVVIALDVDQTPTAKRLARALGWDRGADAMDLENDFSVLYTMVERRE